MLDLPGAETVDQREPPGLVLRIEHADQLRQLIGGHRRPDLHANRVGDAAEILDMGPADSPRPIADPRKVGAEIVPVRAAGNLPGLCLLVSQVHAVMTGEELRAVELVEPAPAIASRKYTDWPIESMISR